MLVNNDSAARPVEAALSGLKVQGAVAGEQSVAHHYWEKIKEFSPAGGGRIEFQLPALSVTTLSVAVVR